MINIYNLSNLRLQKYMTDKSCINGEKSDQSLTDLTDLTDALKRLID